jgi:hypothetical protein
MKTTETSCPKKRPGGANCAIARALSRHAPNEQGIGVIPFRPRPVHIIVSARFYASGPGEKPSSRRIRIVKEYQQLIRSKTPARAPGLETGQEIRDR